MKEFIITAENEGQRFDKYLGRILKDGGMSFIYKMLRKKNFVLNDKKADGREILKAGDSVKLYISDDTYDKFKTKDTADFKKKSEKPVTEDNKKSLKLSELIIYEDKDIIIINKPAGILSQKANTQDVSLNEYLIDYLYSTGQIDGERLIQYKPSVINRLDRNTTGLIIAAKSLKAARELSKGLKDRSINKYYQCVVCGKADIDGIKTAWITKNKSDNTVKITDSPVNEASDKIETGYECISSKGDLSLMKVHLITGKSHQIRAHLSALNHPILGDPKYGDKTVNNKYRVNKQCLHAYRIEFPVYPDEIGFEFSGMSFECAPNYREKYNL